MTPEQASDAKSVNRVHKGRNKFAKTKQHQTNNYQNKLQSTKHCKLNAQYNKCGSSPSHPKRDCPAKEVKCHLCKKGHYKRVRKAHKTVCMKLKRMLTLYSLAVLQAIESHGW